MSLAKRKADEVVCQFNLARPIDNHSFNLVLLRYGLHLLVIPRSLGVRAFRAGPFIGVRRGQTAPQRLWQKGHELGHVLMHYGNQFRVSDRWMVVRQECQAEDFAGWLFLGDAWAVAECWELAEVYGLPEDRIRAWVNRRSLEAAV